MKTTPRIFILSNDYAGRKGFGSEHGLSVLIQLDRDTRWLWDTGQSSLFAESAEKLGLDLKGLKGVAISHGHYDHSGGLAALVNQIGFKGPYWAHPGFVDSRFKFQAGCRPEQVGLWRTTSPRSLPGFVAACGLTRLDAGLAMVAQIPRRDGFYESVAGYFFDQDKKCPDRVEDDACLVLSSGRGPVVLLGCCHSGLANTLYHIRDLLGLRTVYAVAGGFHLLNAPETALLETVAVLEAFGVQRVHPCHCTGRNAIRFLSRRLPGRVFNMGTGDCIAF